MAKNTTLILSADTIKKILTLIQDIPTSRMINELNSTENSTVANRYKRDVTNLLRTLSELKNYTQKPLVDTDIKKCEQLISFFIEQADRNNLNSQMNNSQISDLINYIQQKNKIIEILSNEYMATLRNYTNEVKRFHDQHYKAQEEFQKHLDTMKKDIDETLIHQADIKNLDDTIKSINAEQDDADDDWENDTSEVYTTPLAITQMTSLQNEITALEKLKQHFKENFIAFQRKIKHLFNKLNETEKSLQAHYDTNPEQSNLDKLRSKRESLIVDTEKKYDKIGLETKAMQSNKKSLFMNDTTNSIKEANELIDEIEIKSLNLGLYQNINKHLFNEIKKDILNSAEFKALKEFKPEHNAKATLIKYYLQDITDTNNLEELIKATQADDYDPKAKISMRQNTNLSALFTSFFYYDDDSEANTLATALERKLENIINTQKQLFHDMHRISTNKSNN